MAPVGPAVSGTSNLPWLTPSHMDRTVWPANRYRFFGALMMGLAERLRGALDSFIGRNFFSNAFSRA